MERVPGMGERGVWLERGEEEEGRAKWRGGMREEKSVSRRAGGIWGPAQWGRNAPRQPVRAEVGFAHSSV